MDKGRDKEINRREFLKGAAALGAASAMGVGFPAVIVHKARADSDYIIKLGYYNCDHMTAAPVAKDAGIFQKLGLRVDVTGTGRVPEAMAAGQMDVGYIGFAGMVRAILKGSPMVAVAGNHVGGSMYIVVKKEITKPQELIGKKLGIGTEPEKNTDNWIWFARTVGIPVEGKNYECFAMSDKDKYLTLKTGHMDGFYTCDPWGSMAEYENTGRILYKFGALPSGEWGICCPLVMNRNFVKEHPDLAKKVILAHSMAQQLIYTHPLQAADIFAKNYFVPQDVALMTLFRKTVGETRTLRWKIYRSGYEEQIKHLVWLGTLETAPKFEEIMNPEFLAQSGAPDFDAFIKEKVNPTFPLGMSYGDWKKKAYEVEGKKL